ncbi:uncharacterized protein A1O5_02016 [Cladophialophora psammophila CBS 110553]|uniref:Heterokaryon incompatibility domain-containing protein n=1 Tax=Cladophialophora psammophila CBS 110553 TaxID=1182543 RepID=W9XD99_9EURO|nr:uncharacterized protein A1O5_02016 [Cladophialophora psammophila CBS 110553]EXJ75320.1 hypothetical protein A1O5_02016 [Cladophialophora psammophila CBS 110553]
MAQLCNTCQQIDLHALFRNHNKIRRSREENIDLTLGTLSEVRQRSVDCVFCKLLTNPRTLWPRCGDDPNSGPREDWTLHLSNAAARFLADPMGYLDWDRIPPPISCNVYAYLTPPGDSRSLIEMVRGSKDKIRYLKSLEEGRNSFLHMISADHLTEGRQISDSLSSSIHILKDWIVRCEKNHKTCKKGLDAKPTDTLRRFFTSKASQLLSHGETPQGERFGKYFKLIDVQSQRIVSGAVNSRYVALSYVCGDPSTNIPIDWQHGPSARYPYIPLRLPNTIKDALKLTALLGERYLWVDSLCIIHNDQTELFTLLQSMASIYSKAVCCLAVVSGVNADSGIRGIGVSREGEKLQHCAKLQNCTIGLSLPPFHHILERKTYYNRGWIFQEGLLSRRTIYLTEREAFFSCGETFERESIWESYKSHSSPAYFGVVNPSGNFHNDLAKHNFKSGYYSFSDYGRHVEEYTKRSFTYPVDVMYAFTGTARLIGKHMQASMHYGIPLGVPPWGEQESLVWLTLAWEPQVMGTERRWGPVEFDFSTPGRVLRLADPNSPTGEEPQHAFPSWSWYSLTGPKFYAIDSAEQIKKQMISLLDEEGVRNVNHITQGSGGRFPDPGFLSDPLAMDEDIIRTSPEDPTDVVQQVLADLAYYDMVKTHQRTLPNGVLLLVSNMVRVQLDEDFANWSLNILGNPLKNIHGGAKIGHAVMHGNRNTELVPEDKVVYFASLLEFVVPDEMTVSITYSSRSDWEDDDTAILGLILGGGPPTTDNDCKPLERLGIGSIPRSVWDKLDVDVKVFYLI